MCVFESSAAVRGAGRWLSRQTNAQVVSEIHRPAASAAGAVEGVKQAVGGGFDDDVRGYVSFPPQRRVAVAEPSPKIPGLPVVAFKWTDDFKKKYPNLKQRWVQTLLRARGMIGD